MCFVAFIDPEIQHPKIVFDVAEITSVFCLFKMKTGGGVFNQSAVNVISAFL
jgi:hypothetical protein